MLSNRTVVKGVYTQNGIHEISTKTFVRYEQRTSKLVSIIVFVTLIASIWAVIHFLF